MHKHNSISPTRLRGEQSPHARLTAAQVTYLRRSMRSGVPGTALATELGVSIPTIYKAATGRSWSHLAEPIATQRYKVAQAKRLRSRRIVRPPVPLPGKQQQYVCRSPITLYVHGATRLKAYGKLILSERAESTTVLVGDLVVHAPEHGGLLAVYRGGKLIETTTLSSLAIDAMVQAGTFSPVGRLDANKESQ